MALVVLAQEIQSLNIELSDSDTSIKLMHLPCTIGEFVKDHLLQEDVDNYDIDAELIDGLFKRTTVCGIEMVLFKSNYVKELTKERYAYVMHNMNAFKGLLCELFEQVAMPHTSASKEVVPVSASKEVVPVDESSEKNGEFLPATAFANGVDMMDDFMFNQIMSAVGNNMAISLTLMEKKTQGKLTKPVLTQLMTALPDGYMRGPWASMMVMNILNRL